MHFGFDVKRQRAEFNRKLDDVLGFYGVTALKSDSGITYQTNGKVSTQTEQSMQRIIELGTSGGGIKYFSPGTTVDEQLVPKGVNIHVLGPPRGSLINQSNPSRGDAHETYLSIDRSGMTSFVDGLLGMGARATARRRAWAVPSARAWELRPMRPRGTRISSPRTSRRKKPIARLSTTGSTWRGSSPCNSMARLTTRASCWRLNWQDSGKVLLFPGDAQVGSWLSWHDLEWKVKKGSTTEKRTAKDLLNNTVLYKVSHHGSHNATVKEKGLELMIHPELVAMIPEKEDSYSGILYQPLLDRLNELCKGRVVISADAKYPPDELKKNAPAGLSSPEWESFKDQLTITPLYVEYTIHS